MHLRGDLTEDDFSAFADESVGMTGADIARIVRLARRVARKQRRAVTPSDIMASLPGRITISQKLRRNIAIHELGHAVVAIMTGTRKLTSISVEHRATADVQQQVLGNATMEADEHAIRNKQTYFDNIAILLGGMAAEQVFLGEHGDGVTSDLDDATRIAIILDRHLGMNGVLHSWPVGFDIRAINDVRRHDSALLRRIEPILQEQLARAKTIIESRRPQISGLWLDLIERGSLSGHEIEEKLWREDKIPMPTPRMRRKIRQRLS
ncbi:hypothetical protein [Pararhizobium sp. DWP1-1-3]|uniref:hypothetical protein n=1 Tax=Pararhizobium sp. DWP1-1-3 TaxID=2804652 RepID=UPI003CF597DF